MSNSSKQNQEKTGGKIIYSKGGIIFLFRGRNYNYRTRPRFPLMLWKPVTPVYPRLVQRAPEGLTLEEATEMRKRGRQLPPICKLGKNGVYTNLVNNVREAFEACELVRIDCTIINKSDCRKIGAKLKDLVPCVLISFENENILMWRGKDWKSSLPPLEGSHNEAVLITDQATTALSIISDSKGGESVESLSEKSLNMRTEDTCTGEELDLSNLEQLADRPTSHTISPTTEKNSDGERSPEDPPHSISPSRSSGFEGINASCQSTKTVDMIEAKAEENIIPTDSLSGNSPARHQNEYLDGIMLLLRQAVENGSAVILDDGQLDANTVYERSVALAKSAPPGPVFQHRIRKVAVQKKIENEENENIDGEDAEVEAITFTEKRSNGRNFRSGRKEDLKEIFLNVPHGSLRVDELAKLLS